MFRHAEGVCLCLVCILWQFSMLRSAWTCSLLMLVEDARGDHIEETYSRAGLITAMGSALLCIFRSRWLVYSAGSGVNRVQVVLSGFSMRLFCFVQAKLSVGMVVDYIFLGCLCWWM